MNNLSAEDIRAALRSVKYPGYSRDIVSFGLVQDIRVDGDRVHVVLHLNSPNVEAGRKIREDSQALLESLPGVREAVVELIQPAAAGAAGPDPWAHQTRVPGVRRVLAVASGKGGVGKSTVAVNLACALQRLQARVGLLDCDIYGPSIPLMMGVRQRPTLSAREMLVPPVGHGVKLMSIGFLLDDDQPVIWRGPMIQKTIQQFLTVVEWGELDYLLVDLPPGTGDAQLSLCQTVPLDGGIVVTTPQAASVGVVRKGIAMFQKVNVPIVGIIENMSFFEAPGGQRIEIFGHGGGRAEAARQGLRFLGEIPIYQEIREGGDRGLPVVVGAPDHPAARAFLEIAEAIRRAVD
ncbi:MAG: Mrp/NBP35 family ATP-binding protein [Limisphaera sp.]|nr:Mrp/NBP35 family ATP-binding protein [Limisphaera sp.]